MSAPEETVPPVPGPAKNGVDSVAAWMQAIAPHGIFTTDADLKIRSWNQWLATHSGLLAERVIGRPLLEVFPDLTERRLVSRFHRALDGEISVLSTALHGHLLPFPSTVVEQPFMLQTARIAPLPDAAGGVNGTITIIEDVTQRESQSGALRRQQEMDRLLSTALGELLNTADSVHDVGKIFTPLMPSFGLDAYFCYLWNQEDRNFGLQAAAGIPPRQRAQLSTIALSQWDVLNARGQPQTLEATLATHLQVMERLGLELRFAWPLAIGKRIIGFVSFGNYAGGTIGFADNQLLSRVAHFLAIAVDRAAKEREAIAASRAKDDFLAALSHELRTPLNPVLLVASDAANNPDFPASARMAFRTIEKNAQLEARLIDDLLDLTRIEHGKLHLELQTIDAHSVARDAIANVQADALDKNITVRIDLSAPRSLVKADPARLQQIFWNVLKNGIKFTPSGGELHISSTQSVDGSGWSIKVADTGIGMEPHELSKVFQAFTQGDHARGSSSHQFGGLGLGLAICQKLVELLGGRIEARSQGRGHGSVFEVHFPLSRPENVEAPRPVTEGTAPETPVATRAVRILVVEDHAPTRVPLVRLLNRRGYEVSAVGSAAEALDAASKESFDLVLSDIGLPDMDGFGLMQKLRSQHGLVGVALTGYGMEADVLKSTESGFVAHLTKPIHIKTLEQTLSRVLQPSV